MDAEARAKADKLLTETETACRRMESEMREKCDAMVAQAKQESQAYWREVSEQMEAFYKAHAGLKELLAISEQRNAGT